LHIEVGAGDSGEDIVQRLKLPPVGGENYPKAVIVLIGTTSLSDDGQQHIPARLVQLFGRGLAKAVAGDHALVIDASKGDEAAAALSGAVFDASDNALLIKVGEGSQRGHGSTATDSNGSTGSAEVNTNGSGGGTSTTPEIRYSRYITVKDETSIADVINKIVSQLAKNLPALTLLVNDEAAAKVVVVNSVRRRCPVMVVKGSGGLADQICTEWEKKLDYLQDLATRKPEDNTTISAPFIEDVSLDEIIAEGDLHFLAIDDTPEKLALYIKQRFEAITLLDNVSKQQKVYSNTANRQQKVFRWQQNVILALGVLITGLATVQTIFNQSPQGIPVFAIDSVHFLLVALPALVTVLIAGANRFNPGSRWVMLRTASEIYKREMFRYRTRTGIYSDVQVALNKTAREAILTRTLESTSKQWIENNLDSSSFLALLDTPTKPLSIHLTPEEYIQERLIGQLSFYSRNIKKLERRLQFLQWFILVLGGVTTILGALNIAFPIAFITALATALGGYLEYTQVSNTLKQYKHVSVTLASLQNWWDGLGDDQADPLNVDRLVDHVETTLQTEQAGWVQQMQAALTELRAQQVKQDGTSSKDKSSFDQQNDQSPGANNGKDAAGDDHQDNVPPGDQR